MNLLKDPNKRKWVIVATMFIAIICNYLDRQLLSILKPEILEHFGIGDMQYAWIVNVFLICYALMYPVSGILVDRFGPKRVILISDTMRAAGMSDGDYTLGGQAVKVKGKLATLADGTIAGSVTNLMNCMRTAVSFGIPLEDAVWAAAVNPARAIGIFSRMGSLEPGKRANVVVLDQNLELKDVFFRGELVDRG